MGHEISLISAGEGKETGDASFPVIQTAWFSPDRVPGGGGSGLVSGKPTARSFTSFRMTNRDPRIRSGWQPKRPCIRIQN